MRRTQPEKGDDAYPFSDSAQYSHDVEPGPSQTSIAQARELRRQKAAQTDELLFERVARDRNEEAFSELYDRFSPRVYSLLLHMLRAEEDAQDILQEVFILIWQKSPLYLGTRGNVAGWIISLARNRAVDELRSKRFRDRQHNSGFVLSDDRPEIAALVVDSRAADSELHAAEARHEVRRALRELTHEQRSIIDMAYFGGLTHSEIAARLDMPAGTVKTRIRQAVFKMAKILKPRS